MTITAVPEPATFAMALTGLACGDAVPAVAYQRLADALNGRGFEIERPSGPQPVTVVALLEQVSSMS